MGDTKPFQLIFIGACIILTVVGVFVFSFGGTKKDPSKNYGPQVIIWGTEDEDLFNDYILAANSRGAGINAKFVQKDEASFSQNLLEALATGKGPDVILVSAENLLSYQDKISMIPFDVLTERTFLDTYIQQGELFKNHDGFFAVPFSVDPLVMYWNRDIFTAHDKTSPPTNWTSVLSLVPELRDVSEDLTVFEAAIGLGDYRNVTNAKAILSALMIQSGTPITELGYQENQSKLVLTSMLDESAQSRALVPATAALSFYTQFANPLTLQYTWNRSLSNSIDMFASDDLAIYIGFGSEAKLIRSKNPNLNFDMALIPQTDANLPITYGNLKGFAILNLSSNKNGALAAISSLTGPTFAEIYSVSTGLPPVRRDLLSTPPSDAYGPVLYRSALYSRGFLDPNASKTDTIFQTMVESVLSGRLTPSTSVQTAGNQFQLLVQEFNQKQDK